MQSLSKVQLNFKIEADLKGRAYAAAKDAGQEIGIFISRAIEARLNQLASTELLLRQIAPNRKAKR